MGRQARQPRDDQMGALGSQDIYGALAAINFADMTLRVAYTADFVTFIAGPVSLRDPARLMSRSRVS